MSPTRSPLVLILVAMSACSSSPSGNAPADTPPPPETTHSELIDVHAEGRFQFSGQPSNHDLRTLARDGVTMVVNTRTAKEMAGLKDDEAATVRSLGMQYVHIPLSGEHGFSPEYVRAFARAVEASDGRVHVHCRGGYYAELLWWAYRFDRSGLSPEEVESFKDRFGTWPSVLDQLLGRNESP